MTRRPNDPAAFLQQVSFHDRRGDFQETIEALTRRAAIDPDGPVPFYTLATHYWDKAFRDQTLSDASKRELIAVGISVESSGAQCVTVESGFRSRGIGGPDRRHVGASQ